MTIYIDPLVSYGQKPKPGAARHFGNGKRSCHMGTDGNLEELHRFAVSIGLQRWMFQADSSTPHYDLTPGKREQARRKGAVETESTPAWIIVCRPSRSTPTPQPAPDVV